MALMRLPHFGDDFIQQYVHKNPSGVQHYLWGMDSPKGEGVFSLLPAGEGPGMRGSGIYIMK